MSYKVIDVSEHNVSVDFSKVEADAVILRVGYRGYGDAGNIVLDKQFKNYIAKCNKLNIPVGCYFYSQAITSAEAKAEAKYVVSQLKGYRVDLPVYFDAEYAERDGSFVGRLYKANLSKKKLTTIAKAFCDTMNIYGYKSGVYANYDFYKNKYEAQELKNYSLWIAHYSIKQVPKVGNCKFDLWQKTDDGKDAGVTGKVDMNECLNDNFVWAKCVTTSNLNYRKKRDLNESSRVGIIPKGGTLYVKVGSDVKSNGYTWVTMKSSTDAKTTYYVAKEYLKEV